MENKFNAKENVIYWVELTLHNPSTDEILYAGNYDEVTSCAVTGCGNDRHGAKEGMAVFLERFIPLFLKNIETDEDYEFEYVTNIVRELFDNFYHEEYGSVSYSLGEIDYNYLRFKLSTYIENIENDVFFKAWCKTVKNFEFDDISDSYMLAFNPEWIPTPIKITNIHLIKEETKITNEEL